MANPIGRLRTLRSDERIAGARRALRRWLRGTPVGPALLRFRGRKTARDLPIERQEAARRWSARVVEAQDSAPLGLFDVALDAARHSVAKDKTVELLTIPLALRATTVVELGCAMSYYDAGRTYSAALHDVNEGMMSTRLLGLACQLLRATGTPAELHSVDVREWPERTRSLIEDLGFGPLWSLHDGQNSVTWLRDFPGQIDVLLVDSNHTYEHVRAELAAGVLKMAPRSAIIVDNCYTHLYRPGVAFMSDESPEGIAHGGEFGAILEFLAEHPEWTAHWKRNDVMVMTRGWDLPTIGVSR